jgi:hypothetical protein
MQMALTITSESYEHNSSNLIEKSHHTNNPGQNTKCIVFYLQESISSSLGHAVMANYKAIVGGIVGGVVLLIVIIVASSFAYLDYFQVRHVIKG